MLLSHRTDGMLRRAAPAAWLLATLLWVAPKPAPAAPRAPGEGDAGHREETCAGPRLLPVPPPLFPEGEAAPGELPTWIVVGGREQAPPRAGSGPELRFVLREREPALPGSLVFTPDGRFLITRGAQLRFWDLTTGRLVRCLRGDQLRFRDLTTGMLVRRLRGGAGIALSQDASRAASAEKIAGEQTEVCVWDTVTGRTLRSLTVDGRVQGLAFGRQGRSLAASFEHGPARLFDLTGRRSAPVLLAPPGLRADESRALASSPDGGQLAVATVYRTHPATEEPLDDEERADYFSTVPHGSGFDIVRYPSNFVTRTAITLHDSTSGRLVQRLQGTGAGGWLLAFGPGGRLLGVDSRRSASILVHDVRSGARLATARLGENRQYGLAFHPNGHWLAVTGDMGVRFRDLQTGTHPPLLHFVGVTGNKLAFDHQGLRLALADGPVVRIHDLESGRVLLELLGFDQDGWWVARRDDGRLLRGGDTGLAGRVELRDGPDQPWRALPTPGTAAPDGTAGVDPSPGPRYEGPLLELPACPTLPPEMLRAVAESAPAGSQTSSTGLLPPPPRERSGWTAAPEVVGPAVPVGELPLPEQPVELGCRSPEERADPIGAGSVAWRPDQQVIAVGSWDGAIRLYDPEQGRRLATLRGHSTGVAALAFSPDGGLLASAGGDGGQVLLWDPQSGSLRRSLRPAPRGPEVLEFSPDGRTLASAGQEGRLLLWDPAGEGPGRELESPPRRGLARSMDFSPDGRWLAATFSSGELCLWEMGTSALVRCTEGLADFLTFGADSQKLLVGNDHTSLCVLDVATGTRERRFEGGRGSPGSVALGGSILLGLIGGTVQRWDTSTGAWLGDQPELPEGVRELRVAPDGRTLALLQYSGRVWLGRVDGTPHPYPDHGAKGMGVSGVRFTGPRDSVLAIALDDGSVRLHDAGSGRLLRVLEAHEEGIVSMDASPDGELLATLAGQGPLRLWSTADGRLVRSFELCRERLYRERVCSQERRVLISPDGQLLAASSLAAGAVWDLHSGRKLASTRRPGQKQGGILLGFEPSGRRLLLLDADAWLQPFDPRRGGRWGAAIPPPHDQYPTDLAVFFSENRVLARSEVGLYGVDLATGRADELRVHILQHRPDLAASHGTVAVSLGCAIRIAQAGAGTPNSWRWTELRPELWSSSCSDPARPPTDGEPGIQSVDLSEHDHLVAGAWTPGSVGLWDLVSGRQLLEITEFGDGEWLARHASGQLLQGTLEPRVRVRNPGAESAAWPLQRQEPTGDPAPRP